jgi:hypothetical protein
MGEGSRLSIVGGTLTETNDRDDGSSVCVRRISRSPGLLHGDKFCGV